MTTYRVWVNECNYLRIQTMCYFGNSNEWDKTEWYLRVGYHIPKEVNRIV